MDVERTINIGEGMPLRSGATNIFLNTDKSKEKKNDGTVIQLNPDKRTDLGVHINTTFAIASFKKFKILFVLNFALSIICIVVSCFIAFYYWNELISMRKQIDAVKETLNLKNSLLYSLEKNIQDRQSLPKPQQRVDPREPRMESAAKDSLSLSPNLKKYYVEDLGEDMLLIDSTKKTNNIDTPINNLLQKQMLQRELSIIHFTGAEQEVNMGKNSFVGPWMLDEDISSKNSETKIQLYSNHQSAEHYFSVKEGGVYLVYAQLEYISNAPNFYMVWSNKNPKSPRLISSCGTGDVSTKRGIDQSQITCSVQTVARLHEGETVSIAQREQNRTLWLQPGLSYIGFVKLSS